MPGPPGNNRYRLHRLLPRKGTGGRGGGRAGYLQKSGKKRGEVLILNYSSQGYLVPAHGEAALGQG